MNPRTILPLLPLSFGLAVPTDAYALTCDEIASMVNATVPVPIVVQAIDDSGGTATDDDVKCLKDRGMPEEVVGAVVALLPSEGPIVEAVAEEATSGPSEEPSSSPSEPAPAAQTK
jgi:hypothetical protein